MPSEGEENVGHGLLALQNRYREMEAEIKFTQDDSLQSIKLQRSKISKLKEENARLKSELQIQTQQARSGLQKTGSTTIASLQAEGDYYHKKYLQEKQTIEQKEIEIEELKLHILKQRSDMGGVNVTRETSRRIEKKIRNNEHRLDIQNKKYNAALGHNRKLKNIIENLRRDRAVFDGIYDKVQSDLDTKKEEMNKIMDEAMQAYEARVHGQVEMVKLNEQGEKETAKFDKQWANLNRLIEECQRQNALEHKNGSSGGRKRAQLLINGNAVIDDVMEEEKGLKKRLGRLTLQVTNDLIAIEKATEEVKYYRQAFNDIQEATGISDIEELVENFEAADKENFKLFNEANNLNKDIERLEGQISDMKKQIEKAKTTGFSKDTQRKKRLDELQKKLSHTESKIKVYDEKYDKCMETMTTLQLGIHDILKCMNAEREDPDVLDRVNAVGINETNLMEYLAIIERRTEKLTQDYLAQEGDRLRNVMKPIVIDSDLADDATMGVGVGKLEEKFLPGLPTTLTEAPDDYDDQDL